ncbi:DUF4139 domain-containing protein [Belnapia sp. T18]|uniref:DUF4139 domain-containing protein n=1 Tax=Belnapia arida TaxID=2804533 RepID=A0ABS1TWR2_9PROT|nr:DUF4139 domain-containing protein [Belnapia arida]MBL6076879.1 DUF4139 domain-containing protein [Belnapia arida]
MRRLLLLAVCFGSPALAEELPVRAVTLSNAGLAEIERGGRLEAGAAITFRVPVEDVDDVLKSLVLRDPAGVVEGLRLPAQEIEAEAFRGLPLKPADFENRASLLRALRGQVVEAGGSTGRLTDAEEAEGGLRVSLLSEKGLRLLLLREGEEVSLTDAGLAARIARAAEALAAARAADERQVEIRLRADAAREVSFATVTGAPLWKSSYRLFLPEASGEAGLQGWAVVENRSGVDWTGVRLSLVSGNPAAYRQALYTPIRVERPELPVRAAEQVRAAADTGPLPRPPLPAPAMAQAPAMRAMRMQPEAAPAPIAAVSQALAESAAGRVAFTLPSPVSIRGGETANLPFLEARLPAEPVWWVQETGARNPLSAVNLRNAGAAVLPDGLAAVFDAAGAYLGDAELRTVQPGEQRLLAFARDRDVAITSSASSAERPIGVALRRGVVVLSALQREEVALAVDPRGASGRMVIDLPRRAGARPLFPVAAEGDFGLRTEAALEGQPAVLRFAWEREGRTEVPILDQGLGDPVLLRWREVDVEASLRRLPGGTASLETLRAVLERLPAEAPGRPALEAVVAGLGEARRLLDVARGVIRQYQVAEAALGRARAAAEDRTGAEREEARRRLNQASLAAERAGAVADAAWEAWQRQVAEVLGRTG